MAKTTDRSVEDSGERVRQRPGLRAARVALACATLAVCATQAAAQFGGPEGAGPEIPGFDTARPPTIESQSGQSGPWLAFGVGVLLSGAAVFLALMPSQRTHQD